MAVFREAVKSEKGATLVLALLVITVVVIIVAAIMPFVVNEWQMTKRWTDSVRAFYAAESGINIAISALNDYTSAGEWTSAGWDVTDSTQYTLSSQALTDSSGNIIAYYSIEINNPETANPVAESIGYSPTTSGVKRSIRATIHGIQAAIAARGGVRIKGNATINGDVLEYADFSFEEMFGKTKSEVKAAATTQVVVDPPNNYTPVPASGMSVTWFELNVNSTVMITTTGWSGEGIIIVEGTKEGDGLQITGGDFDGVIWVIGDLKIAGNATIDGGIFVDGSVEDISEIAGTPVITYNLAEVTGAFGYNPMPYERDYWREINK